MSLLSFAIRLFIEIKHTINTDIQFLLVEVIQNEKIKQIFKSGYSDGVNINLQKNLRL